MPDEPRPIRTAVLLTLLLVGGGLAGEYALAGRHGAEKLATALAMPVGLVWLTLLVSTIATCVRGRYGAAVLPAGAFVLLSVAGNEYAAGRAVRALEAPYVDAEPPAVDTAVVLGGGVWQTPAGRPSVNGSGDRVVHAARMYHAGRAGRLHCTGAAPPALSKLTRDEAELTRELLRDLAVPSEAITVGGGANTSEELAALTSLVEDGELAGTLGVVTSAWHMPRVERLAAAAGLEIVPLPADFKGPSAAPPAARVLSAVPTAGALSLSTTVAKEWLAKLVNR